jgi:rhodanese-related sulfurtransferase
MIRWLSHLGTNQRLALVALLLGACAVFASPAPRATVDAREIAAAVQQGFDRVPPRDLADWIVTGRTDYRLIDLRDDGAFATYHIPGAENVPFASLSGNDLDRNEKIILCSADGTRAGQAWVLLKARRFSAVYILDRGLEGWKQDVLFPALRPDPTSIERLENEKSRAMAAHFGGAPRTPGVAGDVAGAGAAAVPMPKVEAPVLPAGSKKAPAKKKEGC